MAGKNEIVGDQQALSHKPTKAERSSTMGQVQLVGDAQSLSRTPVIPPTTTPHMGKVQLVGDPTPLGHSPVKGWGSAANLPMADEVAHSSTVSPSGKGKK